VSPIFTSMFASILITLMEKGAKRMSLITSFQDKQNRKRITFERKVLSELSLSSITTEVQKLFSSYLPYSLLYQDEIFDACVDIAIESYLQGAEYSRFSYYGEQMSKIKERSEYGEKMLVGSLYEYWNFWSYGSDMLMGSLHICCEAFVSHWWMEGFKKGEKRYRLRLH
jgi:hypothetical protein